MHNRVMQSQKFNRWHEKQLISSFVWLVSCFLCGFLFAAVVEYVAKYAEGVFTYVALVGLYAIGIGAIELFRQFWMRFSFAQYCANSATCDSCGKYGLFEVRRETWPIYAQCQHCDHRWVIGDEADDPKE